MMWMYNPNIPETTLEAGDVRIWQIPDKMQHSPDYARLDGVVIRRHESKAAEANILKGWAEADLKAADQKPDTVQIQPSNQVLKYYLSIFACAP